MKKNVLVYIYPSTKKRVNKKIKTSLNSFVNNALEAFRNEDIEINMALDYDRKKEEKITTCFHFEIENDEFLNAYKKNSSFKKYEIIDAVILAYLKKIK